MPESTPTTRRHLGALLAPMYGPEWSEELRDLLGWNESTVRRLGSERFPLNARRLELMAQILRERNPQVAEAEKIAAWCERKAQSVT